jgi:hypothetical protein
MARVVESREQPRFKAKFGPRGVLKCKTTDVDDPTVDSRFGNTYAALISYLRQRPRRKDRPRCGAKTRAGGTCRVRVEFGKARCRFHGGLSTGPKTEAGRARIAEAQRRRWRLYREMRQGMSLADAAVVKEQDSV